MIDPAPDPASDPGTGPAPDARTAGLAALMAGSAVAPALQFAQTAHRLRLVAAWGVRPGARVLEIGCGQGDMTAALAEAVGPEGRVTAVDVAGPDYGAPVTLGQSLARLAESPLGGRIETRLLFDVLDPANAFPTGSFDYVVLAHMSWYLGSLEQLGRLLETVRPWAARLCFAEWDLEPRGFDQVPHMLAALIQGQTEALDPESEANIRTPFTRATLHRLLAAAGWRVAPDAEHWLDTAELADADWEVDLALHSPAPAAPPALRTLLDDQRTLLRSLTATTTPRPLPAYALTATPA